MVGIGLVTLLLMVVEMVRIMVMVLVVVITGGGWYHQPVCTLVVDMPTCVRVEICTIV